jgi:hypothetical protein
MRAFVRFAVISTVFLLILGSVPQLRAEEPADQPDSTETAKTKKKSPPFTISKETTYLTEPLTEDGYVDYLAAMNKMCSEGVTPENNAVLPLLEALGPKTIGDNRRERYFRMLDVAPLPEKGDYQIPFETFYEEKNPTTDNRLSTQEDPSEKQKAFEKFYATMNKPWTAEKHPLYAEWLKANQKPLEKIIAGTKREKYYSPMIVEKVENYAPLIAVTLEMVQKDRESARLLSYHAMYSIGEGKLEDAKQDLLACHRLARLACQGPTLVDGLVGIAIDGIACNGDIILAQSGKLSSSEAVSYLLELKKLPPLGGMAEKLDKSERLISLDCTQMLAINGLKSFFQLMDPVLPKKENPLKELLEANMPSGIEWDEIMRSQNGWYDRVAEIERIPTYAERDREWRKLENELKQKSQDAKSLNSVGTALLAGESLRTIASKKIADVLAGLLMPALNAATRAELRQRMNFDMTQVALALDAYRADNGGYPEKLADLKPKYVAEIPKDLFSDADLIYRRDGKGYMLYSVCYNGKDDGGKSAYADPPDEDGDDWVIRTPKE